MTRSHNNANVLCFAGAITDAETATRIVETWLNTEFEGGRHQRRVDKINTGCGLGRDLDTDIDPDIAACIQEEQHRQRDNIELIASENFTSQAVMQAQGSCLTNKYAEGYPGKRWYGGCEERRQGRAARHRSRLRAVRRASFANVQPHSGSQANAAVYFSVLQPGDRILTMDLSHGGHLTHGHFANFSGKFYEVQHYGVSEEEETIDYDKLAAAAKEFQPKNDHRRRLGLRAHHRLRSACARSPIRSAPICSSTWRTSPAWWPPEYIPRRCRTRTSSPPPPTRACAARAAA